MSNPASTRRSGRRRRLVLGIALVLLAALATLLYVARPEHRPARAPGPGEESMLAIVYREYGGPGVLRLEPVAKPVPAEGQVLLEVHAAAANPLDWHYVRGTPYLMRLESGYTRPADERVGADVAGRVLAIGPDVTRFKVGDDVFGVSPGAFAEFALASERRLASKPDGISYEQAAAIPVAAVTALQGLRDKARLQPGQHVLVNGASGGVGTFAVQIAKALGAEVTGVCSTRNVQLVRSLGADHVVDYTTEDFTQGTRRYDVVLDLVGNRDLSDVRRALTPRGTHVLVGGGGPQDNPVIGPFGKTIAGAVASQLHDQQVTTLFATVEPRDLELLGEMLASGRIRAVIDRRYLLQEVPEALRYLETGRARGKVIVLVRSGTATAGAGRPVTASGRRAG